MYLCMYVCICTRILYLMCLWVYTRIISSIEETTSNRQPNISILYNNTIRLMSKKMADKKLLSYKLLLLLLLLVLHYCYYHWYYCYYHNFCYICSVPLKKDSLLVNLYKSKVFLKLQLWCNDMIVDCRLNVLKQNVEPHFTEDT